MKQLEKSASSKQQIVVALQPEKAASIKQPERAAVMKQSDRAAVMKQSDRAAVGVTNGETLVSSASTKENMVSIE